MATVKSKQELRVVFGTAGDETVGVTVENFDTSASESTINSELNALLAAAMTTVTGGGTLIQALDNSGEGVDVTRIKEAYVTMQTRTWLVESNNTESDFQKTSLK